MRIKLKEETSLDYVNKKENQSEDKKSKAFFLQNIDTFLAGLFEFKTAYIFQNSYFEER